MLTNTFAFVYLVVEYACLIVKATALVSRQSCILVLRSTNFYNYKLMALIKNMCYTEHNIEIYSFYKEVL